MKCRMTPTTSSHVSTTEHRGSKEPETWPEGKLDIQHGNAEVLCLCDYIKVERRGSIQGFQDYKDNRASQTPATLQPLLRAVHTIAVSTSECERAFSCMNDLLTAKRNSLAIIRLSKLVFLKCNGPPLQQCNPQCYVKSWLAKKICR